RNAEPGRLPSTHELPERVAVPPRVRGRAALPVMDVEAEALVFAGDVRGRHRPGVRDGPLRVAETERRARRTDARHVQRRVRPGDGLGAERRIFDFLGRLPGDLDRKSVV